MCNCYKERIIQQKLVPTNMLLNNLKYFINTILFYLSTENIIPLASAFESVMRIVDMAGAQHIRNTGISGSQLEEAKKINFGLAAYYLYDSK